jgi:hypothetical protein
LRPSQRPSQHKAQDAQADGGCGRDGADLTRRNTRRVSAQTHRRSQTVTAASRTQKRMMSFLLASSVVRIELISLSSRISVACVQRVSAQQGKRSTTGTRLFV